MRFAAPELLYLLTALPALALLGLARAMAARRALAEFADAATAPRLTRGVSSRRRLVRGALRLAALGCVLLALARPQGGEEERRERRADGADLFVALDVSQSMLAPARADRADGPTRLALVGQFVDRLVRSLPGDRVGLVVFAGEAFTYCPLTYDRALLLEFLREIEPGLISRQGTNFEAALRVALRSFGDLPAGRPRHLLLLTDGEDHSEGARAAAEESQRAGVTIHGIAFGDERAVPIPVARGRYLQDEGGRIVQSGARLESLAAIAGATGGLAWRVADGSSLEAELLKLREAIAAAPGGGDAAGDEVTFVVEAEYFVWPLLVALALLFLEAFLPERSARRAGALIDYRFS